MRIGDTIAAVATPPGRGAIAVIRISGPQAGRVLLRLSGRQRLPAARRLVLVRLAHPDSGAFLDQGMAAWFSGPRSYSGEDMCELHLHGGQLVVRRVLGAVLAAGARAAEPGEFSLRACLNDKMDLVQAEAVAGLIDASSEREIELAGRHLSGRATDLLRDLQEEVFNLLVRLEADLDFPEDMPELDPVRLGDELAMILSRLRELAGTWDATRRVREGTRVVLVGAPNAGKSSLFNALLGHDRALVTEEPGTTRDYLEEQIIVGGLPLVLVDTAGLRDAAGAAEREGIRRTRELLDDEAVVVHVMDGSSAPPAEPGLQTVPRGNLVTVRTKADLRSHPEQAAIGETLVLSAVTGQGLDRLLDRLTALARERTPRFEEGDLWLVSERQRDTILKAAEALNESRLLLTDAMPFELVAASLREALHRLEETTGVRQPQEVLDRIFDSFCIGK